MDNQIVIVTGANSGIGKATAKEMAKRGAKVIIGCRDVQKGEKAAQEINNDEDIIGNGKVLFKQLDLSSFESIRKFADEIEREEESIDILVNNAGVYMMTYERTKEGFEMNFAVNHLGHFLLTLLLMDKLKRSKKIARIINVSSIFYGFGKIHFDNINLVNSFSPLKAYGQSKLAGILFTKELAKRLQGTKVRVYTLHPGYTRTEIARQASCFTKIVFKLCYPLTISPKIGCQTILHCALDERLTDESGHFYNNFVKFTNNNSVITNYISNHACDNDSAERLWNLSCDLVDLQDKYKLYL